MRTEDQDLIAGFLHGENEAVRIVEDWIVRASSPFRRRLAAGWEDLLQEASLEITRVLERGAFRGEASLKTYLWRVVNHACLRQLRAQVRASALTLETIAERAGPAERSPLNQLLRKESAHLLERVLAEMSVECRRVWQMILDGLSYLEMSERLSTAEGALRVRVLRCRKKAVEARDRLIEKKEKLVR